MKVNGMGTPLECQGQLNLVCDSCDGQRIIYSDDTQAEVCTDCDGSGIDPDAMALAMHVRSFYLAARTMDEPLT